MLADVPQSDEGVASSLAAYSVDEGITRLGGLMVSAGFLLFSLGLAVRGGLYKTTGLLIALVSLVALGSLIAGISSPDFLKSGIAISRACYFPWTIWSVGLGVSLLSSRECAAQRCQ